jgi:hypothetical protein
LPIGQGDNHAQIATGTEAAAERHLQERPDASDLPEDVEVAGLLSYKKNSDGVGRG